MTGPLRPVSGAGRQPPLAVAEPVPTGTGGAGVGMLAGMVAADEIRAAGVDRGVARGVRAGGT